MCKNLAVNVHVQEPVIEAMGGCLILGITLIKKYVQVGCQTVNGEKWWACPSRPFVIL